uniref:Ig-like domain-containing protein n=1 Tax=Astyanax mexicanus TaxID=7994 RepID=A0A3B1J002_ASTMX
FHQIVVCVCVCVCVCTNCCFLVSVQHRDIALVLCSETFGERIYGLDGEEKWHADFRLKKGVMTLPQFADPGYYPEGAYETAVSEIEVCKSNLGTMLKAYKNPAEPKDAPQSAIYSKNRVELGSKNTLICYISGFYPARIGVSWTRNNVNVTSEASLSRYYITDDGTFNLVSALSFTPEEGDIYTCTVEHVALDRPQTKTWEVQVELPGVGASVFCGVGLAVGLLGVAVGTFFLVKGNNSSRVARTSTFSRNLNNLRGSY